MGTELLVYVNSIKSEKEMQDVAYQSMRSKVGKLDRLGAWVGGRPPFAYDKICFDTDGNEVWRYHHTDRYRGNIIYPGGLTRSDKSPRKSKLEYTRLTLSLNPAEVEIVRDIFRWWTTEHISRRQIASRLNDAGRLHYAGLWTMETVTDILNNPSYTGDTVYGRVRGAELYTFDAKGTIAEVKGKLAPRRPLDECRTARDTHPAVVSRVEWDAAQAKLKADDGTRRTTREGKHPGKRWLRGVLYCGHCGKAMTTRLHNGRVVYICRTYDWTRTVTRRHVHQPCHCYKIDHDTAETLILDHLVKLGKKTARANTTADRISLDQRLKLLGEQNDRDRETIHRFLEEGVDAYLAEARKVIGEWPAWLTLRKRQGLTMHLLARAEGLVKDDGGNTDLVSRLEAEKVRHAKDAVTRLEAEHAALTLVWAKANQDRQAVLDAELARLEAELGRWREHTVPLWERLARLDDQIATRVRLVKQLLAEWATTGDGQRSEQIRRVIAKCLLHWRPEQHGQRTRYPLDLAATRWEYASPDLDADYTVSQKGCA